MSARCFQLLLVSIFLAVLSPGCILNSIINPSDTAQPISYYNSLAASEFATEIDKREKLSHAGGGPHLLVELAVLYAHQNNPGRDLKKASAYLEKFSTCQTQIDIAYAQMMLNTLAESEKEHNLLTRKYNKMTKRNKRIEEYLSRLTSRLKKTEKELKETEKALREKLKTIEENSKEIKEKNEMIEKLKALDIQLENRRVETN